MHLLIIVVKMAFTSVDIRNIILPFQIHGIFKGVFPCDLLPKKFTLPAAFIINLSEHDSLGSHWVGLYIDRNHEAEYFDSFGFPPIQNHIQHFIRKYSRNLTFNSKQLQHIVSNKCGKYVILFILCKMYGKSPIEVFEKFSSNLIVNEIVIESQFKYFTQLRKNILYNLYTKNNE